jgi:hypothetical protein
MTEFHQRPFAQRWGQMGDKAETNFLERYPNAHRLGLDRTTLNTRRMGARLRYTPDFLLEDGAYEIMGFASRGNNVLKLKCEKLDALRDWSIVIPTYLWARDSSTNNVWCADVDLWSTACYQHADRKFFEDNNRAYWELPRSAFPDLHIIRAAA